MKFSTVLALGVAPAAMAAKIRNTYPPTRRAAGNGLDTRDGHLAGGWPEAPMAHPEAPMVHPEAPKAHPAPPADHSQWWQGGMSTGKKTEIIIIWQNPGAGHETVKYHEKVTVTQTVTSTAHPGAAPTEHVVVHPPQAAATHTVVVGGPDGLIYSPDHLSNIPVGDMVIFEFLAQNHTVTQSTFNEPCNPLAGGMDTGHQPNPENTVVPPPQVAMQVTTGEPLWFYCKTGNHCSSGMVFSINPTAEKSHAIFKDKAMKGKQGDGAAPPASPPPAGGEAPAAPPAAPPAVEKPVEGGAGYTPGKGYVGQDGSCICMVSCSPSSFPSQVQGLGATGGMAGSLPIRMAGIR